MYLIENTKVVRQSAIFCVTVDKSVVIHPDVIHIAQRNRVVQRIPRTQHAICRRPLREAVVSVLKVEITDDDICTTAGNPGCTADVEPASANCGVLIHSDDRCVRTNSNSDTGLLSMP